MSTSDSLDSRFGESPMQNLSLIHQILDRSSNVFDRHFRIDAMLIEKIYAVGPQPFERSFNDYLDVIWFAVKPRKPLSSLLIYVPTELGSDPDFISKRLDRLTEDPLVFEWPVCLGTVEKRNTTIVACADDADHLRPVRHRGLVPPMHVLNAQPDCRDLQLAQPSSSDRRIGGALRIIPRSPLGTCLILRSRQRQ